MQLPRQRVIKMSFTSVDFPDPDTPVTAMTSPAETPHPHSSDCARGPLDHHSRDFDRLRRTAGNGICCLPVRYAPVSDFLLASNSSPGPETTTLPPCSPAPGPMSTTQSAARMVSSSCSTTITVLPRSRSLISVSSSR